MFQMLHAQRQTRVEQGHANLEFKPFLDSRRGTIQMEVATDHPDTVANPFQEKAAPSDWAEEMQFPQVSQESNTQHPSSPKTPPATRPKELTSPPPRQRSKPKPAPFNWFTFLGKTASVPEAPPHLKQENEVDDMPSSTSSKQPSYRATGELLRELLGRQDEPADEYQASTPKSVLALMKSPPVLPREPSQLSVVEQLADAHSLLAYQTLMLRVIRQSSDTKW
jgi:hypothetical protein